MAKKASVLETTSAALDESPEPAGTEPVTRRSADTGFVEVLGRVSGVK